MRVSGTDMTMTGGDTEVVIISLKNEDGSAFVLEEGDTLYFTVKTNVNTAAKALQKVITAFGDDYSATVRIEHADTKDLPYGRDVYDIQVSKADGTVTTVVRPSAFTLDSEVTHE